MRVALSQLNVVVGDVDGNREKILRDVDRAREVHADLVVMGGYSGWVLKEMTVGSSVNFMLRESQLPILICR